MQLVKGSATTCMFCIPVPDLTLFTALYVVPPFLARHEWLTQMANTKNRGGFRLNQIMAGL